MGELIPETTPCQLCGLPLNEHAVSLVGGDRYVCPPLCNNSACARFGMRHQGKHRRAGRFD
jgi:hypothetical protein